MLNASGDRNPDIPSRVNVLACVRVGTACLCRDCWDGNGNGGRSFFSRKLAYRLDRRRMKGSIG